MIYIYKFISLLLIPIIKLNLKKRIKQKKELPLRYKERYGITKKIFKNKRKIIWIHAASVGEFKSAQFFINNFYNDYNILITTTTISAANYAKKYYEGKIIHQFAPLDITKCINRFLNHWKPSLIIWIESDLWPNTLNTIYKKNIKAILVNLRISPKSFKRWKIFPFFLNQILKCFSEIFAQSLLDKNRIESIVKKEIKFIGNLKIINSTDSLMEEINNSKITINKDIIQIMFSNTHKNEEALLLPIIKELQNEFSFLNIIIAPRHPERSQEIISLCNSYKIKANLESNNKINEKSIIIIDSYGILSKYYAVSDIVFLGGSFISAGGHNPIEPALKKCAIITASEIFNWQNIFEDMIKDNSCFKINNTQELKKRLVYLINNKFKMEELKSNGYKFAKKQFVDTLILDKIIRENLK